MRRGRLSPESGDALREQREWLLSFVPQTEPMALADLGCGEGGDLLTLAARSAHPASRFVGIDSSATAVEKAQSEAGDDQRVRFLQADLDAPLPFDEDSVDVVFSNNLLECLAEPAAHVAEIARVLRPGGSVVVGHWDWDTQLFDAADRRLVRRLVQAFADRQQEWMTHVDGWMGRRLWGLFSSAARFRGSVHAHTLIETAFAPGSYGHERARDFVDLVLDGVVSEADYRRFLDEQGTLDAQGRYFYCITGFAYVGELGTG